MDLNKRLSGEVCMDQMKGRRENKFCCFVYVSSENRRMLCALVLACFPLITDVCS
jgi:hypothetical protein